MSYRYDDTEDLEIFQSFPKPGDDEKNRGDGYSKLNLFRPGE